jgi:hypothetical protein
MQDHMPLELAQFDVRPGTEEDFAKDLRAVLGGLSSCRRVSHGLLLPLTRASQPIPVVGTLDKCRPSHCLPLDQEVKAIREVFGRYVVARAETEHLLLISGLDKDSAST